jgi:hypothetical protein
MQLHQSPKVHTKENMARDFRKIRAHPSAAGEKPCIKQKLGAHYTRKGLFSLNTYGIKPIFPISDRTSS